MTRLGPESVGAFLRQQAEELTRIWRVAHASEGPPVTPALIDGVVTSFFEGAGDLLAAGELPEAVWGAITGVVRWAPPLVPDELVREWGLVREVIAAACDSVNAAPAVAEWLERAVTVCEAETARLRAGARSEAPGVVTALFFGGWEEKEQTTEETVS